jgi:hypothetical protein
MPISDDKPICTFDHDMEHPGFKMTTFLEEYSKKRKIRNKLNKKKKLDKNRDKVKQSRKQAKKSKRK